MSKIVIYYFSGTGNSFAVARDIAKKLKGDLIPIASLMNRKVISPGADIIGIVFPVYYADIPVIVRRFAEKLDNINNRYIFAIGTYGGAMGDSLKTLAQIIHLRGGELSAKFGAHMPQNAFRKPWSDDQKTIHKWKKKAEIIVQRISHQKKGMLVRDLLWEFFLIPLHLIVKPLVKKSLKKISNVSSDKSIEELINLADNSFRANERCNGCGVCSQVCPVKNIKINDGKPVWLNHCENCLACHNWCPNKAIQGDVGQKGYHYRHPEVKVVDIMRQKEISNEKK